MLSREDNEILCRVGRGTPMGELLRRFWTPALLSEELPAPDCPPVRLRLLGEDLVAFRDTNGRVGILEAFCPHKRSNLFWGRNENCGLSCAYHGWKFDVDGTCLETPNEPELPDLKHRITAVAYPAREAGNTVWVYMGPRERMPELPEFEWLSVPSTHLDVSRWFQRTNWVQGLEGDFDSAHISFLHRSFESQSEERPLGTTAPPGLAWHDVPKIEAQETDYGFTYGARRRTQDGRYYWRMTSFMLPYFSALANDSFPRSGHFWVPVDDYHTITYAFLFNGASPLSPSDRQRLTTGAGFPPRITKGAVALDDGYIIDTFLPDANKGNDYRIDRDLQRTRNFSGIFGIQDQDRAIQENMKSTPGLGPGRLVDRSGEHLGPTDIAVTVMRRILLRLAKQMATGIEPSQPQRPEIFSVRAHSAITEIDNFGAFLEAYGNECVVPAQR